MTYSVVAEKKTTHGVRKKPAARKPAPKRAAGAPTIDTLLERVRTRGEALSADIKDLLVRIG